MNTPIAREIATRFMFLRRMAMAAIGEKLSPLGVGVAEYLVLFRLTQEREVPQKSLDYDSGLGTSGVSRMVTRLVDEGLVSMSIDASDRRRRLLSITDAGRSRERELAPIVDEAANTVIGGLSADEERLLLQLLNKASNHLRAPDPVSIWDGK